MIKLMDFIYKKKEISFTKHLNELDLFTLNFCKTLNKTNYVIISGYVAILFGRSRSSEDIDIVINSQTKKEFETMWKNITKEFECLNTANKNDAFEYLKEGLALRFSYKGLFIPNMELKFAKQLEQTALEKKVLVKVNNEMLYISPIDLQIAYKLFLGSEKDIEDARFLYKIFYKYLNKQQLTNYAVVLGTNLKWLK